MAGAGKSMESEAGGSQSDHQGRKPTSVCRVVRFNIDSGHQHNAQGLGVTVDWSNGGLQALFEGLNPRPRPASRPGSNGCELRPHPSPTTSCLPSCRAHQSSMREEFFSDSSMFRAYG